MDAHSFPHLRFCELQLCVCVCVCVCVSHLPLSVSPAISISPMRSKREGLVFRQSEGDQGRRAEEVVDMCGEGLGGDWMTSQPQRGTLFYSWTGTLPQSQN